MKKEKTVIRLLPMNSHHICAIEHWLCNLAKKGLFLKRISPLGFHFTQSTPKNWNYCLDPTSDEPFVLPEKQNILYAEFGWHYIGQIKGFYNIYYNEDATPTPLYTDPASHALAFAWLYQAKKKELLLLFGLYVFVILFSCWIFSTSISSCVLENRFIPNLALLIGIPVGIGYYYQEYRCIKKIKQNLEAGIPLSIQENIAPLKKFKYLTRTTYLLILLLPVFVSTWDLYHLYIAPEPVPIPEISTPLPLFPLEKMEDQFTMSNHTLSIHPGSLLAPTQYTIWQEGLATTTVHRNSTDLSITYYQLRFPALLPPTVKDMIIDWNEMPLASQIETSFFDHAYFGKRIDGSWLFLGKNNVILKIHYTGEKDLLQYLEEFSSIINHTYDPPHLP